MIRRSDRQGWKVSTKSSSKLETLLNKDNKDRDKESAHQEIFQSCNRFCRFPGCATCLCMLCTCLFLVVDAIWKMVNCMDNRAEARPWCSSGSTGAILRSTNSRTSKKNQDDRFKSSKACRELQAMISCDFHSSRRIRQ